MPTSADPSDELIDKLLARRLSLVGGILTLTVEFSAESMNISPKNYKSMVTYVSAHMEAALQSPNGVSDFEKGEILGFFLSGHALMQELADSIKPPANDTTGLMPLAIEKFKATVAKILAEDLEIVKRYAEYFKDADEIHFLV